eukprot:1969128-Pleurochrysis_carterae.AAC.3
MRRGTSLAGGVWRATAQERAASRKERGRCCRAEARPAVRMRGLRVRGGTGDTHARGGGGNDKWQGKRASRRKRAHLSLPLAARCSGIDSLSLQRACKRKAYLKRKDAPAFRSPPRRRCSP